VRRFVFQLYFLMLDGQRSIVSGLFFVMLSRNWVTRPCGTFFKHASSFEKVLGCGHWHLLAESPIHPNRGDQGFVPGLKGFPPVDVPQCVLLTNSKIASSTPAGSIEASATCEQVAGLLSRLKKILVG
jgi:hypothetical protein